MKVGPRLLFCSYHCYVDFASGAALATRDLLELLAAQGWPCAVLAGPEIDAAHGTPLETLFRTHRLPFRYRTGFVEKGYCTLYHGVLNGVDVHGYIPDRTQPRTPPTRAEGDAFLHLFEKVAQRVQPDILLTYGGQWLAPSLIGRAKQRGMKVVFALHNFDYHGAELFDEIDAVLVPSQAAKDHYQQTLRLASTAIPGPWNWDRVLCSNRRPECVTFVNPQTYKGAFWFARIVAELARRRPDISFLVVEGRAPGDWLGRSGLDLSGLPQLRRMANTADPREFYQASRLVLVPSLCEDAFPRVAVEALINGIPVLASRRGGIPEVLAAAGFLFDIPKTHASNSTPSAEAVAPWLATIENLWDDEARYRLESERCRTAAEAWRPERLGPRFADFFRDVLRKK